jgi:hypothetical protein
MRDQADVDQLETNGWVWRFATLPVEYDQPCGIEETLWSTVNPKKITRQVSIPNRIMVRFMQSCNMVIDPKR